MCAVADYACLLFLPFPGVSCCSVILWFASTSAIGAQELSGAYLDALPLCWCVSYARTPSEDLDAVR